jgi:hypothetical protein
MTGILDQFLAGVNFSDGVLARSNDSIKIRSRRRKDDEPAAIKRIAPVVTAISDGMEKRVGGRNWRQIVPCAKEKPTADLKKSLQISGAGRKSRKRPTAAVGVKSNGNCQLKRKDPYDPFAFS